MRRSIFISILGIISSALATAQGEGANLCTQVRETRSATVRGYRIIRVRAYL
jgi:hypothetical protein